jgi:NADP-dependent 3-hydroxy acid dehydrogenase YdfG
MQIKDHVFIVTGASSGIGLSTAMALSDRGAKVAHLARSGDALQKLSQQLPGSLPVTADMTKLIVCGKRCALFTSITAASTGS